VGNTYVRTATGVGIATALSIGDGQGDVQGVWYLEIPADGGTPVFERLPSYAFGGSSAPSPSGPTATSTGFASSKTACTSTGGEGKAQGSIKARTFIDDLTAAVESSPSVESL